MTCCLFAFVDVVKIVGIEIFEIMMFVQLSSYDTISEILTPKKQGQSFMIRKKHMGQLSLLYPYMFQVWIFQYLINYLIHMYSINNNNEPHFEKFD